MKIKIIALATCAMLFGGATVSAQPGNSNSQAGGLPALALEVAELRALVEQLQGQVGEPSYAGSYVVNIFENGIFGCGTGNDPASVIGTPAFLAYLQRQAISSTSQSSTIASAISDGMTLSVFSHYRIRQELRLSGTFETDVPYDEGFDVAIGPGGELSLDAGEDVVFEGQMSDDGSTFIIAVAGQFEEEDCADAFTVSAVGVRK
ncbi:MAG: hypothetical protein WDZ76_10750 [Pseudohongiellaceae bacterium]